MSALAIRNAKFSESSTSLHSTDTANHNAHEPTEPGLKLEDWTLRTTLHQHTTGTLCVKANESQFTWAYFSDCWSLCSYFHWTQHNRPIHVEPELKRELKAVNKKNIMSEAGLWIRIGSGFSDFVDMDPYWESGSGSRGKNTGIFYLIWLKFWFQKNLRRKSSSKVLF
jgi:hypothetical protein